MGRSPPRCSKDGLKKGVWAASEDKILREYVKIHGEGKWSNVAKKTGLKRRGKSCRLRWMNYLRPDIKRDNISKDEEELIIRLHNLLGNRWSLIAGRLPGRTDDEIENYWNTNLAKRAPDFHENKTPPTTRALNGSDPDPEFGMPKSVPSKLDHHHNQSSDGSPSPLSIGNPNSSLDLIMDFNVEDFCNIFDSDYVLDDFNYDRTANSLVEVGDGEEDINIVNVMCCQTEEEWPSDFPEKMKENWRSGSEGIQEDNNQTDMDSELLTLAYSFLESADDEWPGYHLNM